MNKKVLLLSCNTGEGHHSAALAVQEALLAQAELADPLSFASESVRQNATELYNSMIRNAPKAFGVVYRLGEAVSSITKHSPIYIANSLYAENLLRYILENSFDAVVSTHLYGMEACTALRQRQKLPVPAYGVLTDYTAIPFFHETRLNGYFVPHRDLIAELTATGMDASLLHPTGIPVSLRFAQHMPKEQAREHLSLPAGKRIYLVMTGGVGCGNIAALCDAFYIGGTKVGALFGEAVVFPKADLIPHFFTQIKQNGALLAKGRLLGLQFDALFTDGLYLDLSRHAIAMAEQLKDILRRKGYRFYLETPTNQQFVILTPKRVSFGFWEELDEAHTVIRFATSWATRPESLVELEALL